ncbi:hypothetical protein GQ53DRAFT_746789 [Thozetella sp. PMI_491]|nr:hypothetical protein GQ53DRAFT_746789 [Thozetella sp. PMI_491]
MGRLGPLTSLALGRSPYDDIVQGEGELDPRAPLQMYDERGRPINPDTKRINKDVIRSHNEVMLVIGVAEAENDTLDAQADLARRHDQYEQEVGETMFYVGRVVEAVGIWGVNGMRQRILLYKPYSYVPFMELWKTQRSQGQTLSGYLLAGLPSFIATRVCRETLSLPVYTKKVGRLFPIALYLIRHLEMYTFFQRVGLLPSSPWLPGPNFYIPGTAASPIPLPPLPQSISVGSAIQWLGALAVGVAPVVSFFVVSRLSGKVLQFIESQIWPLLPKPKSHRNRNSSMRRRLTMDSAVAQAPESLEPLTPHLVGDQERRYGRDIARDEPTFRALEGQAAPANDPPAVSALRRQSTFSVRGDFGSDDEETEVVSATLISFDVEATESTDTPPGVWSAELRPNVADGRPAQEPRYRDNALTRFPAVRAMQLLAFPLSRILIAPLEAVVWRSLARSYALRRGLSIAAMHEPSFFTTMTWMGFSNMMIVELVHVLFFQADMFALVTEFARQFRMTEEEWSEFEEETANESAD